MDTAHGKHHRVKMFKHLMHCVKIILSLESQEVSIELSVHTFTHTHYVHKIIYIFGGYWVEF